MTFLETRRLAQTFHLRSAILPWRLSARRTEALRQPANSDYLLRSFAGWAAERGETHIRTATAIAWASQSVSVAQRDARLKAQ